MPYLLRMRLTEAEIGSRVVVRWRRPAQGGRDEVADVLGTLMAADGSSVTGRRPERWFRRPRAELAPGAPARSARGVPAGSAASPWPGLYHHAGPVVSRRVLIAKLCGHNVAWEECHG